MSGADYFEYHDLQKFVRVNGEVKIVKIKSFIDIDKIRFICIIR